ncbi:hypothetical protein [Natranaeroarchaeum aerophilus]|uniref:Uncharacterized protein n=1 Tax=Natranaeroarchaeum aerophilus TaxID=2917711 RepID=A0AAE3FSP3_9EURY|nr:hypothetical protein [Natranaeroarchaeum aerophilus]MCL9814355.1 hypothetical protein [Natranaeroarchaeum aerophilus]
MQRGLAQVLYQFMPGKTFDNPENDTIEQVKGISSTDISDEVNTDYLIKSVRAKVDNWDGPAQGFLPPEREFWTIQQPDSVITKVFPLVFRCRNCGHVVDHTYNRESLASEPVNCSHCGSGRLWQIHHVMVCDECSEMESIPVPRCRNGHNDQWMILDSSAERYKNFRWVCKICDEEVSSGLYRKCDCGNSMQPTVHRASMAYRIHSFTDVHIHHHYDLEEGSEKIDTVREVSLGAALGLFEHPDTEVQELVERDTGGDSGVEDILNDDTLSPEQKAALQEKYGDLVEESEQLGEVQEQVNELVDADRELSRNHLNFLRTLEEIESERTAEFLADVDRPVDWEAEFAKTGIAELRLTSEFPILTGVFGYHRTFDDPEEGRFPAIKAFPQKDNGLPIYATRTETEAILLSLDPIAVAEWLYINNLVSKDPAELSDAETRALVYNRMETVGPYSELSEMDEVTEHVHGLLHTVSHELIKEAAQLSGIERTSLAEFLFPEALSIAIYSNHTESFTIGGLYTLVERNLENWLSDVRQESRFCLYDPVCAEQNGTCHACTHISEVSCQHFNQNLSRGHLYGEATTSRDVTGFWELTNGR